MSARQRQQAQAKRAQQSAGSASAASSAPSASSNDTNGKTVYSETSTYTPAALAAQSNKHLPLDQQYTQSALSEGHSYQLTADELAKSSQQLQKSDVTPQLQVTTQQITVKSDELASLGYIGGDFYNDLSTAQRGQRDVVKQRELIYASAMNMATSPGKQLFATAFMLWMSGNTLQVFSIFMLAMAFSQPLSRIMNVQHEFARYEQDAAVSVNLIIPKLIYIGCNLAGVGLALWKCNSFGLLPTSTIDWIQTAVPHQAQLVSGSTRW